MGDETQATKQREPQTEGERKALEALTHLYDRARRRDPELRRLIGQWTNVHHLSAQAIAEITGRPLADVEKELLLPLVPLHHDPIARSVLESHELWLLRARADDDALEEVEREVEKYHRELEREYREWQRKAA